VCRKGHNILNAFFKANLKAAGGEGRQPLCGGMNGRRMGGGEKISKKRSVGRREVAATSQEKGRNELDA